MAPLTSESDLRKSILFLSLLRYRLTMRLQLWNQIGKDAATVTDVSKEDATTWMRKLQQFSVGPGSSTTIWSRSFLVVSADMHFVRDLIDAAGCVSRDIVAEVETVEFNSHCVVTREHADAPPQVLRRWTIGDDMFGICWICNPGARSTKGLCWYGNDVGHRQASFVLNQMSAGELTSRAHPLLPALLTLEGELVEMYRWVDTQADDLTKIQIKTGHHDYADAPHNIDTQGQMESLDKWDLTLMSRRVGGLAVNMTTSAMCLQRTVALGEFILQELSSFHQGSDLSDPACDRQSPCRDQQSDHVRCNFVLEQQVRTAKRRADGLFAEAEAWKHKADILVQTLLSLTSQRDQNVSISIAEDSRVLARQAIRDSTSMKAIAAVTMCFLPGTFVSSVFAMPMIAWNAAPEHAVSSHFWIYWAITVPLTGSVVLVWLFWTNPGAFQIFGRRTSRERLRSWKKSARSIESPIILPHYAST